MNTQKRQKKSGFTLVELMVVAIIVAILAAVAIPLMSGNVERAVATEGQAGISTIATALRMTKAESGTYPASGTGADLTPLKGIRAGDLKGTYFDDASYEWTVTGDDYEIKATVKTGAKFAGQTITFNSAAAVGQEWSGLGQD